MRKKNFRGHLSKAGAKGKTRSSILAGRPEGYRRRYKTSNQQFFLPPLDKGKKEGEVDPYRGITSNGGESLIE